MMTSTPANALGLWPGRSELQEIVAGVFLSNFFAARNRAKLRAAGVTHVLNCGAELDCCFDQELAYLQLPLADNPGQELAPHLGGAYAFINGALREGGAVLVHCAGGGSRSAAVLLAYLVQGRAEDDGGGADSSESGGRMDLVSALELARSKRPIVEPNVGFLHQLEQLEARSSSSSTPGATYQQGVDARSGTPAQTASIDTLQVRSAR